jgi:hypothetical protein
MKALSSRLARPERHQAKQRATTRCNLCRDWPGWRILNIDVDGVETWDGPEPAKPCPRCGWAPVVFHVIEVKDWERVGKHGLR